MDKNNIKLITILTLNQNQYDHYLNTIKTENWSNSYLFIPTTPGSPITSYFIHPNFYLKSYLSNNPNIILSYQESFNYFKNFNLEIENQIIIINKN